MRNLIQNERLKLYKKVSTWVLCGIVVGLSALTLLLTGIANQWMYADDTGSSTETSWKQAYENHMLDAYQALKTNPDNADAKAALECYQYLLDKEIDPNHWKYGLVKKYQNDLYTLYDYDVNAEEYGLTPADKEQYEQEIAEDRRLLEADDWKEYVRLQILEVQNGNTAFQTTEEKQVQIDIWNMYLELNIPPVTYEEDYYYNYGSYFEDNLEISISWQQRELKSLKDNKLSLLRSESTNDWSGSTLLTASDKVRLQEQIDLSTERLKTDTPPTDDDSLYGMMETSLSSLSMLSLLLIVLAGGIIANEYANGTIKLLLITPHKRRSVFWSKVIILVEITLITTGAMFLLNFLISGLFGGFSGIGDMYMASLFGHIVRLPYFLVMVYKYLLFLLPVFAFGALALMLSAVTRKPAVAIAVTILLMYAGNVITTIVSFASDWITIPGIQFLLFSNTNLDVYFQTPSNFTQEINSLLNGMTPDPSMNLIFSIVILVVYTVCFTWIARDSFCRRDVK